MSFYRYALKVVKPTCRNRVNKVVLHLVFQQPFKPCRPTAADIQFQLVVLAGGL